MEAEPAFILLGVIHLLPLPASPVGSPGFGTVLDRALGDAEALLTGGAHGCIIENLGDAPFRRTGVDPHVPAMLAVVAERIRARLGPGLRIGINVLRNDAFAALGAAAACGAEWVRVNVHTGSMWTDQGLIEGEAHDTLRYRRELGIVPAPGRRGTRLVADVLVKHAAPAGLSDVAEVARETAWRGGADILVVTGRATGAPTDLDRVRAVREAVPDRPVWVGSGVTEQMASQLRSVAQGAIVGTSFHQGGDLRMPLDPDRVRRLTEALGAG